jgi:hypothetical protein
MANWFTNLWDTVTGNGDIANANRAIENIDCADPVVLSTTGNPERIFALGDKAREAGAIVSEIQYYNDGDRHSAVHIQSPLPQTPQARQERGCPGY